MFVDDCGLEKDAIFFVVNNASDFNGFLWTGGGILDSQEYIT